MPDVNLENSRPLDVHVWSDHPEANEFVDVIWDIFFAEKYANTGPGKRPKSRPKNQLKVLLLDLYVSWAEDPEQFVGIGMSKRFYKAGSRYNALHISEIMIRIVKTLEAANQIELHRGFEGAEGAEGAGRVTRIKAINLLEDLFRRAELSQFDISIHQDKEVIILNRDGKPIEYDDNDNPAITGMREELKAYNNLLLRTFIDIPTLEEPIITYRTKSKNNEESTLRIGQQNKFVRRIFYRGSWKLGGRFHGGWWQNVGGKWRDQIHINDSPTIEIDYKGLHINLLYALQNVVPPEDPYRLDPAAADGLASQRGLVKQLILFAINAKSEKEAFQAFRSEQPTSSPSKGLRNRQLKQLLEVFKEKNPAINNYICTDKGVELMHWDGQITERLISHFTKKDIPILTIHDSYIVQREHTKELKVTMNSTVKELFGGVTIPIEDSLKSFQLEYSLLYSEPPWDHKTLIDVAPYYKKTEGYLRRKELFNKWLKQG